ncbi:MAG: hypothetical protein AAF492_07780, partial [Verrucomicrobiota bacterium]
AGAGPGRFVIGAPERFFNVNQQGVVFLFDTLGRRLVTIDGPSNQSYLFGNALHPASSDELLVGDPVFQDSGLFDVGRAYRVGLSGGGVSQENTARLTRVEQADVNPSNNLSTVGFTVGRSVDLAVTKTADDPEPALGSTFAFSVVVSNAGPGAAHEIRLEEVLPESTPLVSHDASLGAWSPNSGVWTIAELAEHTAATLTIHVLAAVDIETEAVIENPFPVFNDRFGHALAAWDPDTFIVGTPLNDNGFNDNAGAVDVYDFDGNLIRHIANPSVSTANEHFGHALSRVTDDLFAIGVPNDPRINSGILFQQVGSVYLFDRLGVQQAHIQSPNPFAFLSHFGSALVDVGTNRLVIGQPGAAGGGLIHFYTDQGFTYGSVINPGPDVGAGFGSEMARIHQNLIAVGAPANGTNASGVVYLFDKNRSLRRTIENPLPVGPVEFGSILAGFGGDRLLVGVPRQPVDGMNEAGVVHCFDTNGVLLMTITNPAPTSFDRFGSTVAGLDRHTLLVGDDSDGGLLHAYDTNGLLKAREARPGFQETEMIVQGSRFAYGRAFATVGSVGFSGAVEIGTVSNRFRTVTNQAHISHLAQFDPGPANNRAEASVAIGMANPDQDGDGLLDAWEIAWFGSLAALPGADPDGDGSLNRDEQEAGTDPTDALSLLEIESIQMLPGSGGAVVRWTSVGNRSYTIEMNTNLHHNAWTVCTNNLPGSPPMNTWTDRFHRISIRLYRVRTERP